MIDLEQVHLWWRLFHRDNTSVEVRMIKSDKLNASGYYKNLNNIIRDIDFYDKKDLLLLLLMTILRQEGGFLLTLTRKDQKRRVQVTHNLNKRG